MALPDALRRDFWYPAAGPQPPVDLSQGRRWRHRQLEALLDLPADERPGFAAALAAGDAVAAANAAICLARLGDGRGRERLIETIRSRELRLPLRCAAAEALAELSAPSPLPALRELVDRYGDGSSPAYPADLHAELLYGLAAHVEPGAD
ncbi:MAG TPA: hypothetical protein VFX03_16760, partial [Thermomicrobiales bacterium]|nr:hypothetical protein [Thermomicrobiales bacterium]